MPPLRCWQTSSIKAEGTIDKVIEGLNASGGFVYWRVQVTGETYTGTFVDEQNITLTTESA